jgi:hypothetical protein
MLPQDLNPECRRAAIACRQFTRTVPALPRDEVDMDDVDSRAEDHVGAETRYRLLTKAQEAMARQCLTAIASWSAWAASYPITCFESCGTPLFSRRMISRLCWASASPCSAAFLNHFTASS